MSALEIVSRNQPSKSQQFVKNMLYVKLPNGCWISRDLMPQITLPRESTVSPKQTIINSNPAHALQHDEAEKYKHLWLFPSEHLVVIWRHAMIWANGMLRTLNCCNLLNWWGRKLLCFLLHLEKLFIISWWRSRAEMAWPCLKKTSTVLCPKSGWDLNFIFD